MPLVHSQTPIVLTGSMSADSALSIPITNNSGNNFAYPLAKMVLITALPPGMTFDATTNSDDWMVFASSWNHGQTEPCFFHFNVATAIPADYMLSFKLRVSNFLPLSTDSCEFADTITVNLNPSGSLIQAHEKESTPVILAPNPAHETTTILTKDEVAEITLFDLSGKKIWNQTGKQLLLIGFQNGIYSCEIQMKNGERVIRKLVISH